MGGAVQERILHQFRRRYACCRSPEHRLANHQADIVRKPIGQAVPPMGGFRSRGRRCRDPNGAVEDAYASQRHIVGPEIEGRATTLNSHGAVIDVASPGRPKEARMTDLSRAMDMGSTIKLIGRDQVDDLEAICLLYTSPSPRDRTRSRMPSSA